MQSSNASSGKRIMTLTIPRSSEDLPTALSMIWPASVPPLEEYMHRSKREPFDSSASDCRRLTQGMDAISIKLDEELVPLDTIVSLNYLLGASPRTHHHNSPLRMQGTPEKGSFTTGISDTFGIYLPVKVPSRRRLFLDLATKFLMVLCTFIIMVSRPRPGSGGQAGKSFRKGIFVCLGGRNMFSP
jgi:hypothetical protein